MPLTILIHSSKTMRSPKPARAATKPPLLSLTTPLAAYIQTLKPEQLRTIMQVSAPLAEKVYAAMADWNTKPAQQTPAIDSFVGDIYSGLRASELSQDDRNYAQRHLRILSGLYGILRPYDGVRPYRLEMGYRLPDEPYRNLYAYWEKHIVATLPHDGLVINLSAAEYTKTVLPYVDAERVIAPRFLTVNHKTGQPGQVIVHTKIARGAYARWLISSRVDKVDDMHTFNDLNYVYAPDLSTSHEPTFVCETFGGIGLSMRLRTV